MFSLARNAVFYHLTEGCDTDKIVRVKKLIERPKGGVMWSWPVIAGAATIWAVFGCLIGFALVPRRADKEFSPPLSRGKKALIFFVGFFGWPIIIGFVLFMAWTAWGFPDLKDEDEKRS